MAVKCVAPQTERCAALKISNTWTLTFQSASHTNGDSKRKVHFLFLKTNENKVLRFPPNQTRKCPIIIRSLFPLCAHYSFTSGPPAKRSSSLVPASAPTTPRRNTYFFLSDQVRSSFFSPLPVEDSLPGSSSKEEPTRWLFVPALGLGQSSSVFVHVIEKLLNKCRIWDGGDALRAVGQRIINLMT